MSIKRTRFKTNGVMYTGGYRYIYIPMHPNCECKGYVREHVLVMEQILGRYLLIGECVHHIDGNKLNNIPENLELFNSLSSHIKHHENLKALESCGNSSYRKCKYCQQYDDLNNMKPNGRSYYHKYCAMLYKRKYRSRIKPNFSESELLELINL